MEAEEDMTIRDKGDTFVCIEECLDRSAISGEDIETDEIISEQHMDISSETMLPESKAETIETKIEHMKFWDTGKSDSSDENESNDEELIEYKLEELNKPSKYIKRVKTSPMSSSQIKDIANKVRSGTMTEYEMAQLDPKDRRQVSSYIENLKREERELELKSIQQQLKFKTSAERYKKFKQTGETLNTFSGELISTDSLVMEERLPCRLIIDMANLKKAYDLTPFMIEQLLSYFVTRGVTPILCYDKEVADEYLQYGFYAINNSNVTDDLMVIAFSQHFKAPILSRDLYREFKTRFMYCISHLELIQRKLEKCEQSSGKGSRCEIKPLFRSKSIKLNFNKKVDRRTGKITWVKGRPITNTLADDIDIQWQTVSITPGPINYMKVVCLTINGLDLICNMIEYNGSIVVVISPAKQFCVVDSLILEDYEKNVKNKLETATTEDNIDLMQDMLISSNGFEEDNITHIKLLDNTNMAYYTSSVEFSTPKGKVPFDMQVSNNAINYKQIFCTEWFLLYNQKSINNGMAFLYISNGRRNVKMREEYWKAIGDTVISNAISENEPNSMLYHCWPLHDDTRMNMTGVPFDTVPGMPNEKYSKGTLWEEYKTHPLREIQHEQMIASRPFTQIYSEIEMDKVAIQALISMKNNSTGDVDNVIFTGPIVNSQPLDPSISNIYFKYVLPGADSNCKDKWTINCTLGKVEKVSMNSPDSLNVNLSYLTPLVMRSVRQVLCEVGSIYINLLETKTLTKMPKIMYGYKISNNRVKPNAILPIKFTYTFPYALVEGMIFHSDEHVTIVMLIVPSPPITSAIADGIMGIESKGINCYNDMVTSMLEMEAMELFFPLMEQLGLEFEMFGPFSVLYAVMQPGFIKLGIDSTTTLATAALKALGKQTDTEIDKPVAYQGATHLEFLKMLLDGPKKAKWPVYPPNKTTYQDIHEIIVWISRLMSGEYKAKAINYAVTFIPGFGSMEIVKQHLAECFKIYKTNNVIRKLLTDIPLLRQGECKRGYKNISTIRYTRKEIVPTPTGMEVYSGRKVANINITETSIEVSKQEDVGDTIAIRTSVTPNPNIIIRLSLPGDKFIQSQTIIDSIKPTETTKEYTMNFPYEDCTFESVLNYFEAVVPRNPCKILILASDKFGSILKRDKSPNTLMFVDNYTKIYCPNMILFSALRDKIKKLTPNVAEAIAPIIDIPMADTVPKEQQETWLDTAKANAKGWFEQHKPTPTTVVVALVIVVVLAVAWKWLGPFVFLPYRMVTKLLAKQTSSWLGMAVTYATPLYAKALGALVNFGVWAGLGAVWLGA